MTARKGASALSTNPGRSGHGKPRRAAGLPPGSLREFAFIGDGYRGALIGRHGEVAWLCFPEWSRPALFAGLLGSGGTYRVVVEERAVWGGCYEERSLIWRSSWVTALGRVESREALLYPGEEHRAVLLRRIEALGGPADVTVILEPAADYGRRSLGAWKKQGDHWLAGDGQQSVRWSGAAGARRSVGELGHMLTLHLHLEAGESHDLVLEIESRPSIETPPVDADLAWSHTEANWRREVPECAGMVAARDVRLAVAVLRGMTPPGGGTVAAATTSLPERGDNSRNYDYRFAWIRDTCYVGQAGAALPGAEALLDGAVTFVVGRLLEHGPDTRPAYRTDGSAIAQASRLDVPGYPGSSDVIGNVVRDQYQVDIFGEALLLLAAAAKTGRIDADGWRAADLCVKAIKQNARQLECGIWETEPRLWTHSRLIAAAGLRAISSVSPDKAQMTKSLALADAILAEVGRTSVHESGRFQRAADDERVDASLLLGQIRGAVPGDDPRSTATRLAVAHELAEDGYVYRYCHRGLNLGEGEGAFLICNFWMALACLDAGDTVDAVRWFERARTSCGSPGLFSEEFDVAQHQMRGNLPQAFVHSMLIETAAAQGER
ncbi:MAG TPA: glycoside hydrolase family 15 protein [Acidimicrobiales bacterium]|jgi:GH15 family glucan-1,4-alpha-glucosidase|nr:glycoside hydrolase family 15 protein [Acidimicrobiales bacterium]